MKIMTSIFFVLCFTLSVCSVEGIADTTRHTSEEPPIASAQGTDTVQDYSNHMYPNEELYRTILGDPSRLSAGERIITVWEKAFDWSNRTFDGFVYDENIGYDVRSCDMSEIGLSEISNYNDLAFDSNTVWPETLPEGFDPESLLVQNENPGLGIRALHDQGITGTGVGIAIIDQPLLLDHEQYKDNLMFYERMHCIGDTAEMHGPAVASIAVGQTIGVAPNAKLYYIATTYGHFNDVNGYEFDASIIADAVLRVLEINNYLPDGEKIRAIAISKGYEPGNKGYAELDSAIAKADDQNILVLTTTTNEYYDFALKGMDRDYAKDPDDVRSYTPAWWETEDYYSNPEDFQNAVWVPMGSRTIASFTGSEDYAISCRGGSSWAVPWCAGLYALCCQVNRDITPQDFINTLKSTGITTDLIHDGQTFKFGPIANPAGVIEKLQQ